jgi:hypothetical protein
LKANLLGAVRTVVIDGQIVDFQTCVNGLENRSDRAVPSGRNTPATIVRFREDGLSRGDARDGERARSRIGEGYLSYSSPADDYSAKVDTGWNQLNRAIRYGNRDTIRRRAGGAV